MKLSAFLALLLLVGCATSTGVVPIGQDTYMISMSDNSRPFISGADVKASVFREASQYCTSIGKKFQAVSAKQNNSSIKEQQLAGAEIHFMCLDLGDSELNRPKFRIDADEVIEIRQDINVKQDSVGYKDTYGELLKLDDLRKRGIITEAEFEAQKVIVLRGK